MRERKNSHLAEEGMVRKGGVNAPPSTDRPGDPMGQGETDENTVLLLSGRMATCVRNIVGGTDLTSGYRLSPISIMDIGPAIKELRHIVDEYDKAVMREHNSR